ncbi:MAG: trigger factor [Nitrospinae bacterium]|nr:trigger factor [Nitrospinota bacterium]
MKVEVSEVKPCVKKLKIEVPVDILNKEIDNAYRDLGKTVNIHGFRKGKVPRRVLEQHYSKNVESDVLQKIIPDTYKHVIKEHNLRPVGSPQVEDVKMEQGEPLSFSITVEILPDITLKDYNHLEFTRTVVRVADEDVEKSLKGIQEMHAEFEGSDEQAIEVGDYAILDCEGFSGDMPIKKWSNRPVFVGSNAFMPEIEKEIIGLKKGDTKETKITFPPDYPDKDVAGKEINFKTVVKEVKKRKLKPLDDNFAKEAGGYQNLEELRTKVRENLEGNEKANADSKLRDELLDKLMEMNPIELPPAIVEEEMDSFVYSARQRLASRGIDLDKSGINMNEVREGFRGDAVKSLKGELILGKIAENETITVGDEELDDEIKRYGLTMKENFHVLKRKMQGNGSIDKLKKRMLIDKTFDAIMKKLKVSDIYVERESEVGK